ncbi:MAG: ATP-dependent helicase [Patescibacteria group bacterium]|jgi:DNA helicase-2/ATP-dependent DNA helicase PcrA
MKEFVLTGGLGSLPKIDHEKALNAEQLPVVVGADGPCLVLAGAGSGKTRTITYRVAWLLEHGIPPERVLLLTFTNKASREMIGRIESLLGVYPSGLWAGTFHSIANRLMRQYGSLLGFNPNFSILDEEDARDLLSLCMKDLGFDPKLRRLPSAAVIHECLSYVRNTGGDLLSALERKYPRLVAQSADLQSILDRYQSQKRAQNSLDFDDLLLLVLEILKTHPDVCQQLASRFQYVLVDEFQDTNIVQSEIVSLLSSVHKNLLVVGDDAQSIYSFRAAEIRNILDFPEAHQGVKVFHMTTNYRSTPQILDAANAVIGKNIGQFKKELVAVVPEGEKPSLIPASNAREEAQYILQQIQKLRHQGMDLSNIAVLFRSAFHSQALEFELMRDNLPYEYRGGMRFFERSHIKDAVAHLRVFHNVRDTMAWIRTLTIHPGLGLATANKIAGQCAGCEDVHEAIGRVNVTGKKAQAGWESCKRIWQSVLSGNEMPSMLIRSFVASREYKNYLEHEFPNAADRLDDLEQFAIFADQFQDLTSFLEAVTLTEEYAMREENAWEDRLILSTIHQAKGLEWDAVFIMRLNEGAFPHKRVSSEEEGGMEEERRLFYVAITRARKHLYLTYPLMAGFKYDELQSPSPFLGEIPEDRYEVIKLRHGYGFQPMTYGDQSHDEPMIVLDSDGERIEKKAPNAFLRSIDDL